MTLHEAFGVALKADRNVEALGPFGYTLVVCTHNVCEDSLANARSFACAA
jgi:hypothetical protein